MRFWRWPCADRKHIPTHPPTTCNAAARTLAPKAHIVDIVIDEFDCRADRLWRIGQVFGCLSQR